MNAYLQGKDNYFQNEFAKLSDIFLDNFTIADTPKKPLSTEEVREILKDYPSWSEAVLKERAESA